MNKRKVLYADSSFEDLRDFENALATVGATVVHGGCKIPAEVIASGSDAVCIVTELITLDETEMQKLIRNDGGIILPFFADNVDAGVNKLKFANLSGQSSLDGFRCSERWWFESA